MTKKLERSLTLEEKEGFLRALLAPVAQADAWDENLRYNGISIHLLHGVDAEKVVREMGLEITRRGKVAAVRRIFDLTGEMAREMGLRIDRRHTRFGCALPGQFGQDGATVAIFEPSVHMIFMFSPAVCRARNKPAKPGQKRKRTPPTA